MRTRRFILYARPSFWEGVARLIDFGGALNVYHSSETEEEADEKAIRSDWEAVGGDMRAALQRAERKYRTSA